MTETIHKEGFLLVASMHSHYKNSAIQCIESLEDYYDDPKVVVACHPEWVEDFERLDSVIKVVSDDFPISTRSKLWALQHTVFEKTCYLDADMEVVDEEIGRVFNLLDSKPSISNLPNATKPVFKHPRIEFNKVDLTFNNNKVAIIKITFL